MDRDMLISMLMDGTYLIECHSHEERSEVVEAMIERGCVFMSDVAALLKNNPKDTIWMLVGFRHHGFTGKDTDVDRFDLFSDDEDTDDAEYQNTMSRIMSEDAIQILRSSGADEQDYVLDGFDSGLAQILFCGE